MDIGCTLHLGYIIDLCSGLLYLCSSWASCYGYNNAFYVMLLCDVLASSSYYIVIIFCKITCGFYVAVMFLRLLQHT